MKLSSDRRRLSRRPMLCDQHVRLFAVDTPILKAHVWVRTLSASSLTINCTRICNHPVQLRLRAKDNDDESIYQISIAFND